MQELLGLTRELIRFRSVHTDPAEIIRCADFVQAFLSAHGIGFRRFDSAGVPSILVMPQGDYAPVLLMAHIDVVDGPEAIFEPREKDGRLYGRGSVDDKYAVALALVLLRRQLERLRAAGRDQSDLSFGVLITGDEEIGGANGAGHVLAKIKTDFGIALDGGGLDKIVVKEKGLLRLRLVARGRAVHGSRPWLGENAIENLMADYARLKPFFQASAPEHWHRTLNLGIISGGRAVNQVPDRAEALLDIRFTEEDDVDRLLAEMAAAVRGELVVERRDPLFLGGQSPYLETLLALSPGTRIGAEHGASDARYLSARGIPGIVWGADGDRSQHADDEHVDIRSVQRLFAVLDNFLKEVKTF
jgi:succinyl-diaminopimelate desuccinylase